MNAAGGYSVVISNQFRSVTSAVAVLTVIPLLITHQPSNQTVLGGTTATFSVDGTNPVVSISSPSNGGLYGDAPVPVTSSVRQTKSFAGSATFMRMA